MAQEASHENPAISSALETVAAKNGDSALSRMPALDGLRGTAILIVLCTHFYEYKGIAPYLDATPFRLLWRLVHFGWCGVDLFFVISGFLITSILLNTKESTGYFKSFYGRRAVRIFPLYFLCLFLYYHVPLSIFRIAPGLPHSTHEIWFWSYLANWKIPQWQSDELGLFWSLCVEEQFYFIWPLVIWFTSKRTLPWVCLGMMGVSLAAGIGFEFAGLPRLYVFLASVPRAEGIILGSLLAWLVRQSWLPRVTDQLKLALPASFGLMFLCALDPPYFRGLYTLEISIAAVSWSALLLHCYANPESLAARSMRCSLLRSVGKYSYAIYVLHAWVMYYVFQYGVPLVKTYLPSKPALLAVFALQLCFSYLAGFLSWHLFEKHFLRLKKYFPYRVSSPNSVERATVASAEIALAD